MLGIPDDFKLFEKHYKDSIPKGPLTRENFFGKLVEKLGDHYRAMMDYYDPKGTNDLPLSRFIEVTHKLMQPIVYPDTQIRDVFNSLQRSNEAMENMTIQEFRDVISDYLNSMCEDHDLTKRVCRFAESHEKYLF